MRMTNQPRERRAGFTAVELLIVVSIIAILVALSASAIMRFGSTGQTIATQRNLDKILASLNAQYRSVTSQAQGEPMTTLANQPFLDQAVKNVNMSLSTLVPPQYVTQRDPRVRKEYVRLKVVQAFPMSFAEALAPGGNAALAWKGYVNYLTPLQITTLNAYSVQVTDVRGGQPAWQGQMAVCVLMILQRGPQNAGLTADDLGVSVVGQLTLSAAGIPSSNVQGVLDAWGRAIVFTRRYGEPAPLPLFPYADQDLALLSAGRDGLYGVSKLLAVAPDILQGQLTSFSFTDFSPDPLNPGMDDNILSFSQPGS